MSRVFVSYKRNDKDRVFPIVQEIEEQIGEKCWIDLDGIEASGHFPHVICKAIDACEVLLFMHSASHVGIDYDNDWTVNELNYARAKKKRVVLVKMDDTPLDNVFLLLYGASNNISINDNSQKAKLIKDLKRWLAVPSSTDNAPAANTHGGKTLLEHDKSAEDMVIEANKYFCPPSFRMIIGLPALSRKDIGEQINQKTATVEEQAMAFSLYERAYYMGSLHAKYKLALCYFAGFGVKEDKKKSFELMRSAADDGYISAFSFLPIYYLGGIGTEQDQDAVAEAWSYAASKGDYESETNLGLWSIQIALQKRQNQDERWEEDIKEGVTRLLDSAEHGEPRAQFYMGVLYASGLGVTKRIKTSNRWFEKAAEGGHVGACYFLANSFLNGTGVTRDPAKGFLLMKKAAEGGVSDAYYELGKCYLDGIGVKKDTREAFEWFSKAFAFYKELEDRGEIDPPDYFNLGQCYYYGYGVEKNHFFAHKYYKLAMDCGIREAGEMVSLIRERKDW